MTSPKRITIALLACFGALLIIISLQHRPQNPALKEACANERYLLTTGHRFNNAPPREVCDGKKTANLEIGEYQVGALKFHIPRAYLWQEKYTEGKVKNLYLEFYYPSLDPVHETSNKLEPNIITATIHECEKSECAGKLTPNYNLRIITPRYKPTYSAVKLIPELRISHYTITDHAPKPHITEVYFEGSRTHPTYWFVCRTSDRNPMCYGDFWFKKDISISFGFHYTLLQKHKAIQKSIIQNIMRFAKV